MGFKVTWSEIALGELEDACAYVAQHDAEAAERLRVGAFNHVRVLSNFHLSDRLIREARMVRCE